MFFMIFFILIFLHWFVLLPIRVASIAVDRRAMWACWGIAWRLTWSHSWIHRTVRRVSIVYIVGSIANSLVCWPTNARALHAVVISSCQSIRRCLRCSSEVTGCNRCHDIRGHRRFKTSNRCKGQVSIWSKGLSPSACWRSHTAKDTLSSTLVIGIWSTDVYRSTL